MSAKEIMEGLLDQIIGMKEIAQSDADYCAAGTHKSYYEGKYEAYKYVESCLNQAIKEYRGR